MTAHPPLVTSACCRRMPSAPAPTNTSTPGTNEIVSLCSLGHRQASLKIETIFRYGVQRQEDDGRGGEGGGGGDLYIKTGGKEA